jgi:hypothetical protein
MLIGPKGDRHERALVTVESLSTHIAEQHWSSGRMEYKASEEVRSRWKEVVKLMKEVIESRKFIQKILSEDDMEKAESHD